MRLFAPEGYRGFRCIAGRCRHTCCAHWEIDVDPDTLARYRAMPGRLGEDLRASIAVEDGSAHFVLGEGERCPMLREDGLCRIILEEGEDALCQICTDHPRFRGFFHDRICVGLGLCCEEAAREFLMDKRPFRLEIVEDDGVREDLTEDEDWLLSWEEELLRILCDRTVHLSQRLDAVAEAAGYDLDDALPGPEQTADLLLHQEILDPAWAARLKELRRRPSWPEPAVDFDIAFERLACLLLYRHLPGSLEDGRPEARTMACLLLVRLARSLFAMAPQRETELTDIVRLMSSEIEYSEEAMEALISLFDGGQP